MPVITFNAFSFLQKKLKRNNIAYANVQMQIEPGTTARQVIENVKLTREEVEVVFINGKVSPFDTVLKGNDILVEVNPQTAKSYGLKEGKYAKLSTPVGEARVRVHLFDGVKPGIVAMPRGLGHTAFDRFLAGKGVNFNELIGPVQDPASGFDAAWGIRAQLKSA